MSNDADRRSLIEVIDRPLGFYVLALLIVETFIGVVAAVGRSSEELLQWGLAAGVVMFIYITLTVSLLAWRKPHVLTFDRDAHLSDRDRPPLGTQERTVENDQELGLPSEAPRSNE